MGKERRISVGLTAPEMDEIYALAQRCNTSVSALGQLAILQLLGQARSGAIPMVPPLAPAPTPTSLEAGEAGGLVSVGVWRDAAVDRIDTLQAKIDYQDAVDELDRLIFLTGNES